MKKILLRGLAGLTVVLVLGGAWLWSRLDEIGSAEFWASEIEAFEAADAKRFPDEGLVLFTGSSSVRFWDTLTEDMAPLGVLNRGFGGAHMSHVVHYSDRIITPYAARALVVYAGDNDIGAGKTPAVVVTDFEALVAHVRKTQPEIPIYYITIKASRARWELWPVMDDANHRIAAIADRDPLITVLDVSAPMLALGGGDAPPADLFWIDGLHLTAKGYALWTEVVRTRLIADLGPG